MRHHRNKQTNEELNFKQLDANRWHEQKQDQDMSTRNTWHIWLNKHGQMEQHPKRRKRNMKQRPLAGGWRWRGSEVFWEVRRWQRDDKVQSGNMWKESGWGGGGGASSKKDSQTGWLGKSASQLVRTGVRKSASCLSKIGVRVPCGAAHGLVRT